MIAIDIFDHQKNVTEQMELDETVFAAPVNEVFLHQVLVGYQANKRQGTAATKTRDLVSGGGKKPFRQKGTGRARQGTTRAPHYRGGATQRGPQPRSYRQGITKKMKQEAFRQCLSMKKEEGTLFVLKNLEFPETKTKLGAGLLNAFGADGRTLFVDVEPKQDTLLTLRNLDKTSIVPVNSCSPLDLFESDTLFLTKAAVELFQQRYTKQRGESHE